MNRRVSVGIVVLFLAACGSSPRPAAEAPPPSASAAASPVESPAAAAAAVGPAEVAPAAPPVEPVPSARAESPRAASSAPAESAASAASAAGSARASSAASTSAAASGAAAASSAPSLSNQSAPPGFRPGGASFPVPITSGRVSFEIPGHLGDLVVLQTPNFTMPVPAGFSGSAETESSDGGIFYFFLMRRHASLPFGDDWASLSFDVQDGGLVSKRDPAELADTVYHNSSVVKSNTTRRKAIMVNDSPGTLIVTINRDLQVDAIWATNLKTWRANMTEEVGPKAKVSDSDETDLMKLFLFMIGNLRSTVPAHQTV